jgi:pre-rRNA-processing protein TSR3
VLDPYAPEPVAASDRGVAEAAGIVAIDCSWNRLGDRGRFPEGARIAGARRRLPILIATNPQHYGRVAQLNTVEALAAALRLVGHGDQARSILEGFRGAEQFLEMNRVRFDAYARAKDGSGIRAAERLLFGSDAPPVTPEAGSSGPRSRGARRARPRPR